MLCKTLNLSFVLCPHLVAGCMVVYPLKYEDYKHRRTGPNHFWGGGGGVGRDDLPESLCSNV